MNKNKIIVVFFVVVTLLVFGIMFAKGKVNEDNVVSTYACNYKSTSLLKTKIETVDKNGNVVIISGDIFNVFEDPLSMKDENGNVLVYAGDSYNLVTQNDHGIYNSEGEFLYNVVGEFSFFGNDYSVYDENGNLIATAEFNYFDTTGKMYDASGKLIAQYSSFYGANDYKLYVFKENKIDEDVLQMIFASYVSDKHADGN